MELTELEPQTVQYCFPSKNGSCTKELRSTAVSVILYVSMFAVVILTLCGNLIVIISISHLKQLHTPTNLLVLSLAVADLLVGVFVMPFDMVKLIESCWVFGNLFCSFRNVFGFLLTSVSISSLIFIAIDRYFAVFYPFLYSSKITLNIALFCIVLSWLSSLCYNLSLFYFNGNSNDENLNTCLGDCFMLINSTWGIIDLLVTFILPCSVMIILYAKIFVAAKKQAHAINSITNQITFSNETNRKTSQKSEWKAAKTLGIVVSVFLFCWIPYYIFIVIDGYTTFSVPLIVSNSLTWLVYCNSCINPIIYAFFYPWFQKSTKLILTFRISDPPSTVPVGPFLFPVSSSLGLDLGSLLVAVMLRPPPESTSRLIVDKRLRSGFKFVPQQTTSLA
ncbi:trace amine-associated receptor 13c-like [Lepisosteus oculatus]|uniref:trace amine-associated receptor 13c-like n=1 Tax=Lepisosteus oculatus TaxID=7918 RepID=UPI0035F50B88